MFYSKVIDVVNVFFEVLIFFASKKIRAECYLLVSLNTFNYRYELTYSVIKV